MSASLLLRYSVTEMLRVWTFSRIHSLQLPSHHYIFKQPRYIHQCSWRNFQYSQPNTNTFICSFWSTGPCPPPRTARPVSPVNHSVLSPLLKANSYTPLTSLKLCLLNTRSLSDRALLIADFIADRNLDILCLIETWQQPNDFSRLTEAVPLGFSFISKPCVTGRGTGLTVHSQMYLDHLHHYKSALTTANSSYYSNLINTGTGNNGVLFSTVSHLLQPPKTLPPDISTNQCTDFLDFFSSMINTVHQQLSSAGTSNGPP